MFFLIKLNNWIFAKTLVGYRNVAIEQIYNDTTTDTKAKKVDPIPEPLDLKFLEEFKGKLRIFNRITIIFSENSVSLVTVNNDFSLVK